MTHRKWNWQQEDWPCFSYNDEKLGQLEREYLKDSGVSVGVMRHLSEGDQAELTIELISNEAIETSEIEGEVLDRVSFQSSLLKDPGWHSAFIFWKDDYRRTTKNNPTS